MMTALFCGNKSNTKNFFQILIIIIYTCKYFHHTKRHTESTLRSCGILKLKIRFKFVSQCSLVPYLESEFAIFEMS